MPLTDAKLLTACTAGVYPDAMRHPRRTISTPPDTQMKLKELTAELGLKLESEAIHVAVSWAHATLIPRWQRIHREVAESGERIPADLLM